MCAYYIFEKSRGRCASLMTPGYHILEVWNRLEAVAIDSDFALLMVNDTFERGKVEVLPNVLVLLRCSL